MPLPQRPRPWCFTGNHALCLSGSEISPAWRSSRPLPTGVQCRRGAAGDTTRSSSCGEQTKGELFHCVERGYAEVCLSVAYVAAK